MEISQSCNFNSESFNFYSGGSKTLIFKPSSVIGLQKMKIIPGSCFKLDYLDINKKINGTNTLS